MWKQINFRQAVEHGAGRKIVSDQGYFGDDLKFAKSDDRPDTSDFTGVVLFDDRSILGVLTDSVCYSEESGTDFWTEIWLWTTEEKT